jgi:hypothetical protein
MGNKWLIYMQKREELRQKEHNRSIKKNNLLQEGEKYHFLVGGE